MTIRTLHQCTVMGTHSVAIISLSSGDQAKSLGADLSLGGRNDRNVTCNARAHPRASTRNDNDSLPALHVTYNAAHSPAPRITLLNLDHDSDTEHWSRDSHVSHVQCVSVRLTVCASQATGKHPLHPHPLTATAQMTDISEGIALTVIVQTNICINSYIKLLIMILKADIVPFLVRKVVFLLIAILSQLTKFKVSNVKTLFQT